LFISLHYFYSVSRLSCEICTEL